ncbi:MAG: UvrD-helicase domain-containing protein, partial [Gammaproteobacteria bacterium]|nr:UvrD-helicase domain-containing protein [Gammaproteobacteria bacterium]
MSEALLLNTEAVLSFDLGGVKLIEASAGTGKTYTITNLYLRHVLQGTMPPQILVVTFTNAATEELRGRIRLRLFQALQVLRGKDRFDDEFLAHLLSRFKTQPGELQQIQIQRLRHALAIMDQAAISTIHSFCQRMIQDHALPGLQYFENEILVDDSELWQQAIKDWWRRHTYSLNASEWLLLKDAIKDFDSFAKNIIDIRQKSLCSFHPEGLQPLPDLFTEVYSLEPALGELAVQWDGFKQALIEIVKSSKALSRAKNLPYHEDNIDGFFERLDNYFRSQQLLPVADELSYLSVSALHQHSTKTKRGSDSKLEHEFFRAVEAVVNDLQILVTAIRPAALRNAFEDCRKQVLRYKKVNQKLSYEDLINFTRQALQAPAGSRLAAIIRKQYPVAMIDEFQDTDQAQFSIFSNLYFNQTEISLALIGDPKQAIYSFRGGDIFTYMQARQAPLVEHCVLKTNWRSQPGLVNAVNQFFSNRNDPFIYSESINFLAAESADKNRSSVLLIDEKPQPALTLWQIPAGADLKPLNKETASDKLNAAVAAEIVALIKGGESGSVSIDGEPLIAGNIAILVRTSSQGEAMRQALVSRGVGAIAIGRDKVFNSEESAGLSLLLNAAAHPVKRRKLRLALTSQLLNFNHLQMLDISDNEQSWQDWIENFKQLHNTWVSRGFIPMFQQMLQTLKLAEKLANRDQAERRLTNLLHLGELLQQQSLVSSGIDNLLNWFNQQQQNNSSEEAELRLESDHSLVKIITIHKSKGLEFPVVFLPYLWDCYPVTASRNDPVYFHDDDFNATIDLGSAAIGQHYLRADKERLAEDVRLLYVALTRARSKVYLAWGEAGSRGRGGNSTQTALAYLLHSTQTPDQLTVTPAAGIVHA